MDSEGEDGLGPYDRWEECRVKKYWGREAEVRAVTAARRGAGRGGGGEEGGRRKVGEEEAGGEGAAGEALCGRQWYCSQPE